MTRTKQIGNDFESFRDKSPLLHPIFFIFERLNVFDFILTERHIDFSPSIQKHKDSISPALVRLLPASGYKAILPIVMLTMKFYKFILAPKNRAVKNKR
jgi:hypothetical protein